MVNPRVFFMNEVLKGSFIEFYISVWLFILNLLINSEYFSEQIDVV